MSAIIWALGDYATVAEDLVRPLGTELVAAAAIRPGQRVLDVAAGTGNAAIIAAQAGAKVVASDVCPKLLEQGRTAAAGVVDVDWCEADAEALPFTDGEFDAVISCIGVMFAPHHQRAADELVRVCRPGGTIAVLSWTPEGFIGPMFAAMKPYLPAPPPGTRPGPLWGDPDYVRGLFGDRVEIDSRRGTLAVDSFPDGTSFRDYFKANYGPMVAAYASVDPANAAGLDADLAALGDAALAGSSTMDWEYLIVTGRRR